MVVDKIKRRLAGEGGFTLIELLIVLLILGILVTIAVPSYLGFRVKAQQAAAQANVRSSIPAAESYYQDPAGGNNSYATMTGAKLRLQAPGLASTVKAVPLNSNGGYCIEDTQGTSTYDYLGGSVTAQSGYSAQTIQVGTCLAAGGTAAT